MEYLDENGELVNNNAGYALRKVYYHNKQVEQETYWDKDMNLVNGPDGYARRESTYRVTRHLETTYYDAGGNLYSSSRQYARRVTTYHEVGNRLPVDSDIYYAADGSLFVLPAGYAGIRNEYKDGKTLLTKTTYIDGNGDPVFCKKAGYASLEYKYKGNNIIREAYFDADGTPIAGPKGYAYVDYEYTNNQTKPTKETYFDAEGNPYRM